MEPRSGKGRTAIMEQEAAAGEGRHCQRGRLCGYPAHRAALCLPKRSQASTCSKHTDIACLRSTHTFHMHEALRILRLYG